MVAYVITFYDKRRKETMYITPENRSWEPVSSDIKDAKKWKSRAAAEKHVDEPDMQVIAITVSD